MIQGRAEATCPWNGTAYSAYPLTSPSGAVVLWVYVRVVSLGDLDDDATRIG